MERNNYGMPFIDRFDRNKPLQDQLDFPLKAEGLELILEIGTRRRARFLLKTDQNVVKLSRTESIYMTILMTLGFATKEELYRLEEDGSLDYSKIRVDIGILNRKIGYDAIKSVHTSGDSMGGFYIGELSNHRNEEKYLEKYECFVLNSLTRYVKLPNGNVFFLTDNETKLMRILFRNNGRIHKSYLAEGIYGDVDSSIIAVDSLVGKLNRKLGERYIKRTQYNFYELTQGK